MKHYLNAMLLGTLIAGFIISLSLAIYWHPFLIILSLVQGALQGLASVVIYRLKRPPYLVKVVIQMVASWFLAFTMLLFAHSLLSINLWLFTLEWFVIWLVIFVYFYFRAHQSVEKINKKIKSKKEKEAK